MLQETLIAPIEVIVSQCDTITPIGAIFVHLVHEDEPQLTPIFKELYVSQIFSEHISGVIASLYKIEGVK